MESEEDLIAAVQQIVKALESKKYFTEDSRKILASLGLQLSEMGRFPEVEDEVNEITEKLSSIENRIMNWEKEKSLPWIYSEDESFEYFKDVDDVRKMIEVLEFKNSNSSNESMELLCRAYDVLQTAMAKLEEEFRHLLIQNRQPFEPSYLSFRSNEEDLIESGSVLSSGDESVDDLVHRDSFSPTFEDCRIELLPENVVRILKRIANSMCNANYSHECFQVFITSQKDALDDCLFILDVEKLSIEDVLKIEWNQLNSKIRRWIRAMKIFIRVCLVREKTLTDEIFGEIESSCFEESSKSCILQLLNFCEAIVISPHQPEKLIRILDMYEALADLIPDIVALYSDKSASFFRTECHDVLTRIGDYAKTTFVHFEKAVASDLSSSSFPGGGVHHLTRYVLNYINVLMDYSKTIDIVMKEKDGEKASNSSMAENFRTLISILERNIIEKSNLYKDESQQHFFVMNNIHYIIKKIENSEMRTVIGDEWIRKCIFRFQHHEMSYQRSTWSSILGLLSDEGIQNPGSNSVSRTILKDRIQRFYSGFEEVYKNQTSWVIKDSRLRDDLRISTSLKVVQAYRAFVGRHSNHISEKYIKYTADDLEGYLLHLFEGSQRSLHGGRKKFS